MAMNWEDVSLILNKFVDDETPLFAVLLDKDLSVMADTFGTLSRWREGEFEQLKVVGVKSPSLQCLDISFELSGCVCRYTDSREAPIKIRNAMRESADGLLLLMSSESETTLGLLEINMEGYEKQS